MNNQVTRVDAKGPVRLFAWVMVFLVLSSVVAAFVTRQTLVIALEQRTQDELRAESEAFRELVTQVEANAPDGFASALQAFRGRPSDGGPGAAFLFVNGEQVLPIESPEGLRVSPEQREQWATLTTPTRGTAMTPSGTVDYLALPLRAPEAAAPTDATSGDVRGVFVTTVYTGAQRADIADTVTVVGLALLITLVAAAVILWWFTDRLLPRAHVQPASSVGPAPAGVRPPPPASPPPADSERPGSAFPGPVVHQEPDSGAVHPPAGQSPAEDPVRIVHGEASQGRVAVREHGADTAGETVDLAVMTSTDNDLSLELEEVELGRLTVDAYSRAQQLADRSWVMDIPSDATLRCDYTQVMTALDHVAAGAAARTQPGDMIFISAVDRGGGAEISIGDEVSHVSGAAEALERAFVHEANAPGAPEGLRFVHAVAAAHGGEVLAESRPSGGLVVRLVLDTDPQ